MFGKQNEDQVAAAVQDFLTQSLAPFRNSWERLVYISGFRRKSEAYSHWGMEQTYGSDVARHAVGEAHRQVVRELLATPSKQSLGDLTAFAEQTKQCAEEVAMLIGPEAPPNLSPTERKHLEVELETIRLLTEAGTDA